MVIHRYIHDQARDSLNYQSVVALIGPRQVGKTTLALEIGREHNALYLDLENPEDRARLANPKLFFERFQDRLIILDEIHKFPDLFQVMRGVVDEGRRQNNGTGRFLVLGSASLDLLNQSGETLAGRIAYIDMTPLHVLEITDDPKDREQLWLRGGFPQSFLAKSDAISFKMRRDFIRTYLERDVPLFGPRIPAETLERLWTMLAHLQGSLLNSAELGRSLEMSTQTVNRYIDLLVDLLLVHRLRPYHANVSKRLVKSPKVYIRDCGLLHALLGIDSSFRLMGHPIVGESWEGFVLESLLSVLPWRAQAYFYRTTAGAEIDLVIEHASGELWAIEIKRGAPKLERGFYHAHGDLKPHRCFVVCARSDRYPIAEGIEVIGIHELAQEISKAS